ncbi:hypothetical protein ACFL10_01730 [Patescibacteria group bacterium]
MDLKAQLQELIKNSPTLKSLSAEERAFRSNAMLSGDEAALKRYIEILEEESAQMKQIDENFAKEAEGLNELVEEVNQLEKEAEGVVRKEEEAEERVGEEEKAEELIKKLNEVANE